MGGPGHIDGIAHDELDNFYECHFIVDGLEYPTSETYFQSQKATNEEDREKLRGCSAMKAWVEGNKINLRKDWEEVKVDVMYTGNYEKFAQNENEKNVLISSKGDIKFYNSTGFWNKWNTRILSRVRAELRNADGDDEIVEQVKKEMEEYRSLMKK
jgi:ribA/ribD-fused uncharacterized protein